jgi:hypothetical protein
MCIESSLDFVYLLNSSNSIGSAYIDSLHHFLKQNNFKLQVEDIAVSNRTPVAVIAQSLRHEVGNDYKEELCEVLSEMKSIEIDPKRVELRWETVSLPSQPNIRAMMIKMYADPLIADQLSNQLKSTNRTVSAELYSKTYCWKFFQAKETDNPEYALLDGINKQLEYQSKHITAIVSGLKGMDLYNTIPAVDTTGRENKAQLKILNIMVGADEFDRASEEEEWRASPFIKVHYRGNGQYAFVGLAGEYDYMYRYLHARFPQNLKAWFPEKMSDRPTIHIYGFNPDTNDDESRCEISLSSEGDHENEQEEDFISSAPKMEENQNIPPCPSINPSVPNAPNPYDQNERNARTNTGINPGVASAEMPQIRNGLTSEEMEWILNAMMSHNSIRIQMAMEDAFKVVDPAARLVQALNQRDEKWYSWIWEGLSHMIYDAVQGSLETFFANKVINEANNSTSGNDERSDDEPNEMDVPNDDRSQDQKEVPSHQERQDTSESTPSENEKTTFQTPLSTCTVLDELTAFAAEKDRELKRTQISFDKYAEESVMSPINKTMETASPNTAQLREELQNTVDKSTWENALDMSAVTSVIDTPKEEETDPETMNEEQDHHESEQEESEGEEEESDEKLKTPPKARRKKREIPGSEIRTRSQLAAEAAAPTPTNLGPCSEDYNNIPHVLRDNPYRKKPTERDAT